MSRARSPGLAMFTGISSGNRCTWNISATDMLTIWRRTRCGWVFFDQENSSMARNTVNPSSWIFFAISLWDKVNGSKVPGKNAIFSRVLVSTRPPNNW